MSETIQVQQRFPGPLLSSIDGWALENHFTRTAAVNYMCGKFFLNLEIERLRDENVDLRKKVVALAMGRGEEAMGRGAEAGGCVPAVASNIVGRPWFGWFKDGTCGYCESSKDNTGDSCKGCDILDRWGEARGISAVDCSSQCTCNGCPGCNFSND